MRRLCGFCSSVKPQCKAHWSSRAALTTMPFTMHRAASHGAAALPRGTRAVRAAVLGTAEYPQRGAVDRWHRATVPRDHCERCLEKIGFQFRTPAQKALSSCGACQPECILLHRLSPHTPHGIDSGTRTQTCTRNMQSSVEICYMAAVRPSCNICDGVGVSVCVSISISMYILMYVCIYCTRTHTHTRTRTCVYNTSMS